MNLQAKDSQPVVITETKWCGRFCIKATSKIDRDTGQPDVTFQKWVNARYLPSQKRLINGYWTPVRFQDFDLRKRLQEAFSHMLPR